MSSYILPTENASAIVTASGRPSGTATTKMTIPKIITTFSQWNTEGKSKLPVVEMISRGNFPINETLLPLFKRKLISYVSQKHVIETHYGKTQET
jgi:hypothetical protein